MPAVTSILSRTLLAAVLAAAAPAWADVGPDGAAAVAQRISGGRVLSVDRSDSGRRVVWRVKVITARGEVRVVLIDGATGQPL